MDSPSSSIDFAAIGHQDSWQHITVFINSIRSAEQETLSPQKIKEIFSFIPPRDLFRIRVKSKTGTEINGVFIETFIDPDKLESQFTRTNISKVMKAITHAKKMGAKIVTLGGFTSIVLEGNVDAFSECNTKFTTGNTLTASFIVKGIEKAVAELGIKLHQSAILIVGATGDIGLACINYFKNRVRKFLLCARIKNRLQNLSQDLINENIDVDYSISLQDLIPNADIIICVASSTGIKLANCKKNVLICDAGYPKNLETSIESGMDINLFHGGMGQVSHGFKFIPDYSKNMYKYAAPYIVHGCLLEAMVLAFENKFENYSVGKGNITTDRMEQIYNLSLLHGISLAPFYNAKGLW